MPNHPHIAWQRLAAEGVVIAVSILLALWADAWWSDRQRGIEETAILTPLVLPR